MSKTRKEKMIETLEGKIDELEKILIETPPEMTKDKYRELISEIKEARQMLEIVKKM